jgi:hypothetical protein
MTDAPMCVECKHAHAAHVFHGAPRCVDCAGPGSWHEFGAVAEEARPEQSTPGLPLCETCHGDGEVVYPDTTLGRGGFGGQQITAGPCRACNGTGRAVPADSPDQWDTAKAVMRAVDAFATGDGGRYAVIEALANHERAILERGASA